MTARSLLVSLLSVSVLGGACSSWTLDDSISDCYSNCVKDCEPSGPEQERDRLPTWESRTPCEHRCEDLCRKY